VTVSLHSRTEGFVSGVGNDSIANRLRRIWQYRRLIAILVRRDLKVKYAGSALGYLWSVLEPLAMSIVYWFVFTKIVHRNVGYSPYILFLVTGQLLWFWFLGGVTGGMKALRAESQMVRSTNVPREAWVVRVVATGFVSYLFSLPVVVIFAAAYQRAPTRYIVLLPVGWILEFGLIMGLALMLAPLSVLVKDINRVIPVVVRILFYMTPILYAPERVPAALRPAVEFNPIAGIMTVSRSMFFPREFRWIYVMDSAITSTVVLVLGLFVFRRLERQVLKEI
jgi:ABC-2 type transport system permease protein